MAFDKLEILEIKRKVITSGVSGKSSSNFDFFLMKIAPPG